jgi:formylglycine-generating enzyme
VISSFRGELLDVEVVMHTVRHREVEDLDGFLSMIEVPGGTFQMGSPRDEGAREHEEGPVHQVRLSAFAIGKYLVTQAQYRTVMGYNPGDSSRDDLPVNKVTWFDTVRFCNRLSDRAGLQRCYQINERDVTWDREAVGYRLPTEAEWEYACRAGTTTAYSFGDDAQHLDTYAWFEQNANDIKPVGSKLPNPWGLHDVHGHLWQWCWDWDDAYPSGPVVSPVGPPSGRYRTLRGGSFWDEPGALRSAARFRFVPDDWCRYFGFRCARSLAETQ